MVQDVLHPYKGSVEHHLGLGVMIGFRLSGSGFRIQASGFRV